ncbi:MAG TPA: tRNA lysidine(34) synthetase TilS [Thermoanaerobaculia bacterium]|nr:tRNA lysidine(34) synthetase TilS [Thermoanaerobaculia bacterium]
MIDLVRRFFAAQGIEPCHVLVAASGGIDSTALLLLLAELREDGFKVTAGHVNHHLRGADSEGDEAFVRDLCSRLGIDVHVADGTLDPEAIRASGLEAAARDVRHEKLTAIAGSVGARYVATAHQKDDQAETVLMRLLTGTSLGGLRGIHPRRDDGWIRPLLEATRAGIEEFLTARDITPRTDHTNADPRFLRNRVRKVLRDFGPPAVENLASIATQAQQFWPAVEKSIDAVERSCTFITEDETRFVQWPQDAWLRQALLNRHIRRLGGSREISSDDLQRLASAVGDIRRVSVTRELELVHQRGALVLRRTPEPAAPFEVELDAGSSAFISEIGATISVERRTLDPGPWTLVGRQGPRSKVQGPFGRSAQLFQLPDNAAAHFTVRNRRRGDRFQPLGLPHDKKLKDFLIDRKIEAEVRDRIPLLIWNGEIVWVAGVEIAERFKVTSPAGTVYEVKLEDA